MIFDWPHPIDAILFDMDGTLLDSEPLTESAILCFLEQYGIHAHIDCSKFHGVTWNSIERALISQFPVLDGIAVADELSKAFHLSLQTEEPPPILGAIDAVYTSAALANTAVVSSSRRNSIHFVIERMGMVKAVHHIVGAEDVQFSKPNPQCFQMAADYFEVPYERCLVFEDSVAGLQAAHNAGMATIAIGPESAKEPISTLMIHNYQDLPSDFFELVCQRG